MKYQRLKLKKKDNKDKIQYLLDTPKKRGKQLVILCLPYPNTLLSPPELAGFVIDLLNKKDKDGASLDFQIVLCGGTSEERKKWREQNREIRHVLRKAGMRVARLEDTIRKTEAWEERRKTLDTFLNFNWEKYKKTFFDFNDSQLLAGPKESKSKAFLGLLKHFYRLDIEKDATFKIDEEKAQLYFETEQKSILKLTDDYVKNFKERQEKIGIVVDEVECKKSALAKLADLLWCMRLNDDFEASEIHTRLFYKKDLPPAFKRLRHIACFLGYDGESLNWEPLSFEEEIIESESHQLFPFLYPAEQQSTAPRPSSAPIAVPRANGKTNFGSSGRNKSGDGMGSGGSSQSSSPAEKDEVFAERRPPSPVKRRVLDSDVGLIEHLFDRTVKEDLNPIGSAKILLAMRREAAAHCIPFNDSSMEASTSSEMEKSATLSEKKDSEKLERPHSLRSRKSSQEKAKASSHVTSSAPAPLPMPPLSSPQLDEPSSSLEGSSKKSSQHKHDSRQHKHEHESKEGNKERREVKEIKKKEEKAIKENLSELAPDVVAALVSKSFFTKDHDRHKHRKQGSHDESPGRAPLVDTDQVQSSRSSRSSSRSSFS